MDATDGGADAARRAAELVKRLNHRRNARRIRVGKPEVVVRAEVERPLLAAGQTGRTRERSGHEKAGVKTWVERTK